MDVAPFAFHPMVNVVIAYCSAICHAAEGIYSLSCALLEQTTFYISLDTKGSCIANISSHAFHYLLFSGGCGSVVSCSTCPGRFKLYPEP